MATLTLGSFNLMAPDGSARVMAEGTSWGSPVPIEVAVQSWLQDGAIVVTQGHDNREVNVRVRFYGDNLTALNTKEAALFAELEKPNKLTWTPNNGPASVFVVVTSSLAQDDESFVGEVQDKPWRTYSVRLVCEAFTQSLIPFTSVGLPATGSTTTVLDACAATTGWTGFIDGVSVSPTTSGGSVLVTGTVTAGRHTFSLQKTFAATTTSTKFLALDWLRPAGATSDPAAGLGLSATGDGVTLPLLAEIPSTTSGYVRSYFQVAATSLAVTRIDFACVTPAGSKSFSITEVDVTNVNPIIGTGRQQAVSLAVPGSARTQGSLAIESATAALGDTLVYVYPRDATTSGYSPPLRQFRSSGNTVTADAAQVSGSTEPINGGTGVVFTIPIGLFPAGSYLLMARLATAGGGTPTITYEGRTLIGAGFVSGVSASVTVTTTTAYQTFALARMQLPTSDLDPGSASVASMYLKLTSVAAVTYDEVWLFNTTIGRLIRVDCGTGAGTVGGTSRRLFIEPATVTTPRPTVRIGHSADRSDSHYPDGAFPSWQQPEFKPPQVNALVVTPNATDAVITLSGYARWHTNAAS